MARRFVIAKGAPGDHATFLGHHGFVADTDDAQVFPSYRAAGEVLMSLQHRASPLVSLSILELEET